MSEGVSSNISTDLKTYCNQWFTPNCYWNIPDLKQTEQLDKDKKKALISKGVIGLRQCLEANNSAIKAFGQCEVSLIRSQLDVIALKYGYEDDGKTEAINLNHKRTLEDYRANQDTINVLNTNMGGRVTACVFLSGNSSEVAEGRSFLSILTLMKRFEAALLKGAIRCGVLKTAMVMSKELRRPEYEPVVENLAKELHGVTQKLNAALVRIPAGVIGNTSVKDMIEVKLKSLEGRHGDHVQLIRTFEVFAQMYGDINATISSKLASRALPIEQELGIISIVPAH